MSSLPPPPPGPPSSPPPPGVDPYGNAPGPPPEPTPWWKKRWVVITAATLVVLFVIGTLASPSDDSEETADQVETTTTESVATRTETTKPPAPKASTTTLAPTTTTTIPPTTAPPTTVPAPPASIVKEGVGDDVLQVEVPGGDSSVLVYAKHSGQSNFAVKTDSDLLVNEIGSYEGVTYLDDATGLMEISADGPWRIEFRSTDIARPFAGGKIDGRGDDVLWVSGGGQIASMSHTGESNFAVKTTDDLLVNEIGAYNGRVRWPGSGLVVITADGNWTIDVTD